MIGKPLYKNILSSLLKKTYMNYYQFYEEGVIHGIYKGYGEGRYRITMRGRWLTFLHMKDNPGSGVIPGNIASIIFRHYENDYAWVAFYETKYESV